MTITIIGASAGVGLETVKRSLQRQHKTTTLSRSPILLPAEENLTVITGSATVKEDLQKAIANADAVIVALGTGMSRKATTLYSRFADLLVEVQWEIQMQIPFIIVTGFGAGNSKPYLSTFGKLIFSTLLKAVYSDKSRMEEIISSSKMKWEIVRPGRLIDKPLTENYKAETTLFKGINIGNINRADVADFLVKQAENPTSLYQYVALSNQ